MSKREIFSLSLLNLVAISLMIYAGCALNVFGKKSDKPSFPHKFHAVEMELECDTCHTQYQEGRHAGLPDKEICLGCHEGDDGLDENAVPFFKSGQAEWENYSKISNEVNFEHKIHIEAEFECIECHKGVKDVDNITPAQAPQMSTCVKCHSEMDESMAECSFCHKRLRRDVKPESHKKNWQDIHGGLVRYDEDMLNKSKCYECHKQSDCMDCHQNTKPKSHTNHWRQRGHGIQARIDRDYCSACHDTDYCIRCHQNSAPRTHNSTWASNSYNHCTQCHFPLSSMEQCSVCHKDITPMLAAAPNPPSSVNAHVLGTNCIVCHNPMPHPNPWGDASACLGCHVVK